MHKRKFGIFFVSVIIVMLLTSCYHFESKQGSNYDEFYQYMEKRSEYIYDFLPSLSNDSYIKDMYIFFSDRDLIDSYYTVYVNCQYSEEEYQKEQKRICEIFERGNFWTKDSESFDFPSVMSDNMLEIDGFSMIMCYKYVLFDESDFRIVYVTFFDKKLNGTSTNIPTEYLPKELVALRKKALENRGDGSMGTVLCVDKFHP